MQQLGRPTFGTLAAKQTHVTSLVERVGTDEKRRRRNSVRKAGELSSSKPSSVLTINDNVSLHRDHRTIYASRTDPGTPA